MARTVYIVLISFILGSVLGGWKVFSGADRVLFPQNGDSQRIGKGGCGDQRIQSAYRIAHDNPDETLARCHKGQSLEWWIGTVVAENGMRIRYALEKHAVDHGLTRPIWLHIPGQGRALESIGRYSEIAARTGLSLATLDLSNQGESEHNGKGITHGCREADDITAVARKILARFPRQQMVMSGSGLGANALLLAASNLHQFDRDKRIVALALETPSDHPLLLAEGEWPFPWGGPFFARAALAMAEVRVGSPILRCLKLPLKMPIPTLVQARSGGTLGPFFAWMKNAELSEVEGMAWKLYPSGDHERLWNAQPEAFEHDLGRFWQQQIQAGSRVSLSGTSAYGE